MSKPAFQMQTNKFRAHTQPHSGPLSLCPNHPGSGARQLGIIAMPQSPLKLFKLVNPEAANVASPVPSCRNHNKGSCPHSPLSLCLLTSPGTLSGTPLSLVYYLPVLWCAPSFWELWVTNSLFNVNHLLLALWCPNFSTNNYIFKYLQLEFWMERSVMSIRR